MDWFIEIFTQQTFIQAVLVLSLICAAGLALAKIKIRGVSLGVTFVFFSGILAGHFGLNIDPRMLALAQNFGLILFVYSLGLQVGPSFFGSLKRGGLSLNLMAFTVLLLGTLMTLLLARITPLDLPVMMGLFSGAVTNTPMLGAAQQSLLQVDPAALDKSNEMAMACAVGYPFGVIGVILCILILKALFLREGKATEDHHDNQTYILELRVSNPAIFGKTIREIMKMSGQRLVISRVWKNFDPDAIGQKPVADGMVIIPTGDTIIEEGELVLILCKEAEAGKAEALFGQRMSKDWNISNIDWNSIDSHLVSRHVLITKSKYNGSRLGDLHLRNSFGVNITRVNRAGIDILPTSGLTLQLGDKLTIVGESKAIDNVAAMLGNKEKELRNPNLLSIFVGIVAGLILGSVPLNLPGMTIPIRLGIAGGPIIVGILMGAFGPKFHIATYTTHSANLMMRQLGITVYLAGLGLSAGPGFFETVFRPEGLIWVAVSLALAIVPVLIVGLVAGKFFHCGYQHNAGMLCGAMANPIALNYALSTVDDDDPSVAYATVYPICMFLRVVIAQMIMLVF